MSPRLEVGTVIAGRYQLERLLGQGGMATVWEAKHLMTRRLVAMKFLHAAFDARPEMRRRFLREAQAAAAVDHPNVVTVHDVFQLDDGMLVLVMARLEGETLAAHLMRQAPLSVEETVAVLAPVVSAVGSAHSRGIIHRDLKPDNVFLSLENGATVVRVLDFGIAKLAEQEESGDLTTTGTVLGTPCYMAPEQAYAEKNIDHRADIWSLGAMLYEALTGDRPIEGESLGQVVKLMVTQGITPIFVVEPGLPSDISFLVTRMLSIDPEGRPSDLREVHAVLARYARTTTPSFGPPISSETHARSNDEKPLLPSELPGDRVRALREPARLGDDIATLPQVNQPERKTRRSAGSTNTPGAHSLAPAPRAGHRWLYLVLAGLAAALLLFAIAQFRSPTEAGKRPAASYTTALAAAVPAAQLPSPPPQAPAALPTASAAPVAAQTAQAPRPLAKAPYQAAAAASSRPAASAEPTPAAQSAAPRPSASSPPKATTGLHEAVPF